MNAGNVVLCCIRSDYYRAALILTHIAFHAVKGKGSEAIGPRYVIY
jgi:hypothetical protein